MSYTHAIKIERNQIYVLKQAGKGDRTPNNFRPSHAVTRNRESKRDVRLLTPQAGNFTLPDFNGSRKCVRRQNMYSTRDPNHALQKTFV